MREANDMRVDMKVLDLDEIAERVAADGRGFAKGTCVHCGEVYDDDTWRACRVRLAEVSASCEVVSDIDVALHDRATLLDALRSRVRPVPDGLPGEIAETHAHPHEWPPKVCPWDSEPGIKRAPCSRVLPCGGCCGLRPNEHGGPHEGPCVCAGTIPWIVAADHAAMLAKLKKAGSVLWALGIYSSSEYDPASVIASWRRPVSLPTFEEAWAEKERDGYRFDHDALRQVRFGWEIATAKHIRFRAHDSSIIADLVADRMRMIADLERLLVGDTPKRVLEEFVKAERTQLAMKETP